MTTQIDLIETSDDARPVIENLAQLYQYDFSEMSRGDPQHGNVRENGRFHNIDFDRFYAEPDRHAYLIRVNGELGGFVLVSSDTSFRDRNERVWWIDEFFVMRKYRRLGVGEHVATTIFDRFPGTWQVAEMDINGAAQVFWRAVIGRYTDGDYEEMVLADERWLGPVQYFRSRSAS